MRWQFRVHSWTTGLESYIVSSSQSSTVRSWTLSFANLLTPRLYLRVIGADLTTIVWQGLISGTLTLGAVFDVEFNSGIVTVHRNGSLLTTTDISASATVLYHSGAGLAVGGALSSGGGATFAYNGELSCFKIWVDNILDTDTPKFVAPMGDKQGIDLISGTIPAVVGTVDMTARADDASYNCEENGFAVKTGKIYPKNYAGTGYAGLVGDPDATYQGLIATKGQPEIGTKQYLGTEYDFGDAVAITDAGISWDEWDDTDDNLNTVGTAETDLDMDYYNAITASLMTCTSIAGYAGTSNVSKRLFFKVADRVMKGDGSFLAESGRVQEIMVYKRDLTAGEILRVQKYCREVV